MGAYEEMIKRAVAAVVDDALIFVKGGVEETDILHIVGIAIEAAYEGSGRVKVYSDGEVFSRGPIPLKGLYALLPLPGEGK